MLSCLAFQILYTASQFENWEFIRKQIVNAFLHYCLWTIILLSTSLAVVLLLPSTTRHHGLVLFKFEDYYPFSLFLYSSYVLITNEVIFLIVSQDVFINASLSLVIELLFTIYGSATFNLYPYAPLQNMVGAGNGERERERERERETERQRQRVNSFVMCDQ